MTTLDLQLRKLQPQEWVERRASEKLKHYASSLDGLKDLNDLGNADENTRQDYAGRFAFELLQNSADAHEKAVRMGLPSFEHRMGRVTFVLTRQALVVANTGAPFSHIPAVIDGKAEPISSLESISRLGESTKRDAGFMGNKGIGFRSIYEICSRLWLISGKYQIRYDGHETHRLLKQRLHEDALVGDAARSQVEERLAYLDARADRIPMMKVGVWFDPGELPEGVSEIVNRLRREAFDTILVLERPEEALSDQVRFTRKRIEDLSEQEMLFLDNLCEVRFQNTLEPERSFQLRMDDDGGEVRRITRSAGKGEGRQVKTARFRVHRFDIPDLKSQRAAIAFRLDDEGRPIPAPLEERVFYTFYPASGERHGFPFYIHSVFRLSPSRKTFNTERDPLRQNRRLLDDLATQITRYVVPALLEEFPDAFATELLLPRLGEVEVKHLTRVLDGAVHETEDLDPLVPVGALTARFTAQVLLGLRKTALVRDLTGEHRTLPEMRLPREPTSAPQVDRLLGGVEVSKAFPVGTSAHCEALLGCLSGLGELAERLFPRTPLTLPTLVDALIAGHVEAADAGTTTGFLRLVGVLDYEKGDEDPLGPLRAAGLRLLMCSSGPQPLPALFGQNKKIRLSPTSPLIFYRRAMSEGGGAGGRRPNLTDIPDFCHAHVLSEAVLGGDGAAPELRAVLEAPVGLRVFNAEDVFKRIAEAMFEDGGDADLSDDQHRALLETIMDLVKDQLLGLVERGEKSSRWYMHEGAFGQWETSYSLAKSWIPIHDTWVRADGVILSGDLGHGDSLRALYPPEQRFLDEGSEAPWLQRRIDEFFEQHVSAEEESPDTDLDERRLGFRAAVYRMLGAWDGLRLDVVHHRNFRSDTADPSSNPHQCVSPETWDAWVGKSPKPFKSWSLRECRLVRSAALPHADWIRRAALSNRSVFMTAMVRMGPDLARLLLCKVLSKKGNSAPFPVPTLLYRQLLTLPWNADPRDVTAGVRLWYTRSRAPGKTTPSQEAHYLNCVTATQMPEELAKQLRLPVLETSEDKQAYLELYKLVCRRVLDTSHPPPGQGLSTLYKTVISRLQQILLGPGKTGDEKLREKGELWKSLIAQLHEAGVLIHQAEGLAHAPDPTSCYYDDGADSNPVFRRDVPLVAFDGNSQGISSLLRVRRLKDAAVIYDDGRSDEFDGHDIEEEEIERKLAEIKAPLFAFLAYSHTIPVAQRMSRGSPQFRERWDGYDWLRIEVTETLRITVDGGTPWTVPSNRNVVLEHAPSPQTGVRRMFVFARSANPDGSIPVPPPGAGPGDLPRSKQPRP